MNNTRVFRFLSIALLAAIALYFAAQGYFALTGPLHHHAGLSELRRGHHRRQRLAGPGRGGPLR